MNENTKSRLAAAAIVVVGLAIGFVTVAYVNSERPSAHGSGDYSQIHEDFGAVVLFTIPGCQYCAMARDWLRSHRPEFREVSLAQHPEYKAVLAQLTDVPGVPITIIGSRLISGFHEDHLRDALARLENTR